MGILAALDSWGAKRWPVGWIRVRRMGVGWKTILGAVLFYAPDIMAHAPSVVSALGLDDAKAASVVKGIGTVLFLIGAADKYLKFTKPIERRQGERVVITEAGRTLMVAPLASTIPIASPLEAGPGYAMSTHPHPHPFTPEEKVVFDNVFAVETTQGEPLEVARAHALEAVAKVSTQAKDAGAPTTPAGG